MTRMLPCASEASGSGPSNWPPYNKSRSAGAGGQQARGGDRGWVQPRALPECEVAALVTVPLLLLHLAAAGWPVLPSHRHSQRSCRHSTEAALPSHCRHTEHIASDCHRIAAAAVTAPRPHCDCHAATVAAPRPHCHRIVTVNAAAVTAPRPHCDCDCHAATAAPRPRCHRIAIALPSQSTQLPSQHRGHTAIASSQSTQLPSQHRGRTATAMQRLPSHCRHSQRSCRHSTEAATAIALPSQSAPRANSKRAGLQLLALALD